MKAYVVVGKPYVADDGYGIYAPDGFVHHELEVAQKEADRRARLEPGESFIIMEAVAISEHVAQPQPVQAVSLRDVGGACAEQMADLRRKLDELNSTFAKRVEEAIASAQRRNVRRS
ncbi:hypothetical protein [Agrobacterium tumefaciens]|uniref:hypothetical protein n=1 Tax=Agrobacterium tumefaciens TaxID=358 RepID=UPI00023A4D96|nr:hypothetical protein AT5A_14642 [Agrobacterium tumefaciens 5A]